MAAEPPPTGPGGMGDVPPPPPPPAPPMGAPPAGQTSSGMDPKLAALLSYLFGWLGGLIFFLIEKNNREVRFHAAQSLLFFAGLTVVYWILAFLPLGLIGVLLTVAVGILGLIVWIMGMIKGYALEHWKLPVVGDFAENMAGGSTTTAA